VPTSETNFILGARGRLGTALASSAEIGRTVAVDRSIYSSWAREGSADEVANYFAKLAGQAAGARVLVASGITDPMRPREEHHSVNYVLPRNVIEGAHRCGMKVVTFGSIMELTARDQSENAYLSSKVELGDFVSAFSAGNEGVVHIRIHTLYGGGPPRYWALSRVTRGLTCQPVLSFANITMWPMKPGQSPDCSSRTLKV